VKRAAIKRTLIPALRLLRWVLLALVAVLLLAEAVVCLWLLPRTG
jgi:hypothetical protein